MIRLIFSRVRNGYITYIKSGEFNNKAELNAFLDGVYDNVGAARIEYDEKKQIVMVME